MIDAAAKKRQFSVKDRVYDALADGPLTAAQIAAKTLVPSGQIACAMVTLRAEGKADRTDMGRGRGSIAVYGRIEAGSVVVASPTRETPEWPLVRVTTLLTLWGEGKSCSEIGRIMGVSRNTIIGKVSRLNLHGRDMASALSGALARRTPRPAATPKSRTTAKPRLILGGNNQVIEAGPDREPVVAPPRADAFQALPGSTPLNIMQMPASRSCKWPIDVEDAILSCCQPTDSRDDVYCPAHAAVAYSTQKPKHRTGNDLARSLRRFV